MNQTTPFTETTANCEVIGASCEVIGISGAMGYVALANLALVEGEGGRRTEKKKSLGMEYKTSSLAPFIFPHFFSMFLTVSEIDTHLLGCASDHARVP